MTDLEKIAYAKSFIDKLAFGSYNDRLIFNTDKNIKYLDPLTMTVANASDIDTGDDNIYRMYVSGDTAYYMYSELYSVNGTTAQTALTFGSSGPVILPPRHITLELLCILVILALNSHNSFFPVT